MLDSVEGIVIREKDYGESSKIIDVFTKKYGLISILSKGSKRIKSDLSGVSSKLTYGKFYIYYKKDKLSTLTSVDIINNLRIIKTDIVKIGFSTYLCELIGQVIKQVNKNDTEDIYDLFISTILKINEGYDSLVITNILELKLLDYLGVSPSLDGCAICDNTDSILTLSAEKNGLLCKKCRTIEKLVNLNTIKYIRMYYYVDISKITKLEVDNTVKCEIDNFLNEYYLKSS
jgi:DNA repair protein RecO (recombination protein O)